MINAIADLPENEKRAAFLLELHEPVVLETFHQQDVGTGKQTLNEFAIAKSIRDASEAYLTFNERLIELIKDRPSVRFTLSVSGPTLLHLEAYAPDVLESFRKLAETGAVEFLGETSHHSLACMLSVDEFRAQIDEYREMIYRIFGTVPVVFKNTGLIYQDDLGKVLAELGFAGVLTNGDVESEEQCYTHPVEPSLALLVRHASLSRAVDQLMDFRLSPEELLASLGQTKGPVSIVTINYKKASQLRDEFGTHPIIHLFEKVSEQRSVVLSTFSDLVNASLNSVGKSYKVWNSVAGGVAPWLGNEMQHKAFDVLSLLREPVSILGDESVTRLWKALQDSDHFFYMRTDEPDNLTTDLANPYKSAYEAFANYMNILNDFAIRLNWVHPSADFDQSVRAAESERHHVQAPLWAIESESIHKHVSESRL